MLHSLTGKAAQRNDPQKSPSAPARHPQLYPQIGGWEAPTPYFRPAGNGAVQLLRRSCACSGHGECPSCKQDHEDVLRRSAAGPAGGIAPPIVDEVLRSPGQSLDGAARSFLEPRFGYDLGRVRVHNDRRAAQSAEAVNAHAYAVGNHLVFGAGRYAPHTAEGVRLLAHELSHVVQQDGAPAAAPGRLNIGKANAAEEREADAMATRTTRAEAPAFHAFLNSSGRQPRQQGPHPGHQSASMLRRSADAPHSDRKEKDKKKTPANPPGCDTGCAQRWGQETTCSKWGFVEGVHETGEGKKWRSYDCCNSWPLSLEEYARAQLGINGAASCPVRHEREIATITFGEKEVDVLCSDTLSPASFGQKELSPTACKGKIDAEVIEMSPKAMLDLSGSLANALPVTVCYSGAKQDLCLHNGPGAKNFPTINQCLTKGCPVPDGAPSHKTSGWPLV